MHMGHEKCIQIFGKITSKNFIRKTYELNGRIVLKLIGRNRV
jgi:hypothetical protein